VTEKIIVMSEDTSNIPIIDGIELTEIEGMPPLDRILSTTVRRDLCCGCRICEDSCTSLIFDEGGGAMTVNGISCKGCGTCVAVCPSGALQQKFSDGIIFSMLDGASPSIIPLYCNACPCQIFDIGEIRYPSDVTVIRLMCSGRMEPSFVLDSFDNGVDGVLVIGCYLGNGHEDEKIDEKVKMTRDLMEIIGLDVDRLRLEWISSIDVPHIISEFSDELRKIESMRRSHGD
jgi:heterodisulfide reductase subunit A